MTRKRAAVEGLALPEESITFMQNMLAMALAAQAGDPEAERLMADIRRLCIRRSHELTAAARTGSTYDNNQN